VGAEGELETPVVGADDQLEALAQPSKNWMKQVAQQKEEAIDRLRADLDRCWLREWNELDR
jgi:hypothetical protein